MSDVKADSSLDLCGTGSSEQKEQKISNIDSKDKAKTEEEVDEDDDEEEDVEGDDTNVTGDKKKKKKKKGKKKKKPAVTGSKLPLSRCLLGFTDSYLRYGQTDPPTRLVADLFPTG